MAKDQKNKKHQQQSSSNLPKVILLAVIVLVGGYLIYDNFIRKDEIIPTFSTDPNERIKNIREPQFKNEGSLEFTGRDKKTLIRKIDVEIADNDHEREQGLMYRRSMDDSKGMLFIFSNEEPQSFWMKNTVIPLDIMYVNGKNEIVKIYKNTTPFSETSLPSLLPSMYVVEVAGGFSDRYGVREGDIINFVKNEK